MGALDRAVAAVASRQHGVIHREQAIDAGASAPMIRHRLRTGAWIDLQDRVYALDTYPATWQRDVMAAVVSRFRSFASGPSASRLHGLWGRHDERPEITVPATGSARSALASVRRRADFPLIETTEVSGIPVSSVAETLFDCARLMARSRLERTIDDALARELTTADDLREVLERVKGKRLAGTPSFRKVVEGIDDGYVPPVQELEFRLYRLLDHQALPSHERQARLSWWDELPHRVDAVIPEWRLIIEGDGRAYHTKRVDFETDRSRDNLAAAHGYRVMRFTYQALEHPERCLALLFSAGSANARARSDLQGAR
jgi:very-short-patch-repair endonuclease